MPLLERWNGTGWDPVSPPASNPSGIIPAYNNPPASPQLGQQYFDITLNLTRTWNGSGWSPAPPSAAPPSVGIVNAQGVSLIPSAADHVHAGRYAPFMAGYGLPGPVVEKRASGTSSTTATAIYTVPAGSIAFAYCYALNNGASSTISAYAGTAATPYGSAGSTQFFTRTAQAAATNEAFVVAPLDSGDSLWLAGSVASVAYYLLIFEFPNAKADGYVITKVANIAANADVKVYQPSAGKSARGIGYYPNVYQTNTISVSVATNVTSKFSQAGGAVTAITAPGAAAVGTAALVNPAMDIYTSPTDALYMNASVAGMNYWGIHQEY